MVERLVALHGGTVAVTSQSGRGSCFTVWLPWEGEAPAASAPEPMAPGEHSARPLGLIIEDNAAASALMRAQLEALGFEVREVDSAEAALALVDQCVPALITLDIVLPGMDGWELLARLRGIARWASVPVVVVSVVADQSKGFSLGAALVLQKPITRDALGDGLARLGLTPGAGRDVTVLVVDDDPSAVELLAGQLQQNDCLVLRAHGGREGIELARRFRPDLITLDLDMPQVNGFDVVQALKDNPTTAQIPVIVVTSKDLTQADRQRLNGHILDIVGKGGTGRSGWFIDEVQRALYKAAA
jgi:CheY-like chemotaxis protein